MQKIDRFLEKSADRLIWAAIGLYVVIFSVLSGLKYYSFHYLDMDFASDVIVYWNSLHGKLLYYPFREESIFGGHLYLIIFLVLPIYAIFQHPLTVLFLQSLTLGLAAWPLYLLAKLKLDKTSALSIALVYLFFPALGFMNLFETHFDSFALFFLFFALYYFEKQRFAKFLAFCLLAMTCKENVSMLVFMFGVYALIQRRSKRWCLLPFFLGLAWFFSAVKWIIPSFAKDAGLYPGGFIFRSFYAYLGSNLLEMVKTIILHPVLTLKFALLPYKVVYLLQLLAPTVFMALLAPPFLLMALPIFAQNLLSSTLTHAQIYYHYTGLLIPFLFGGVVFAFNSLLKHRFFYTHRFIVVVSFMGISLLAGFWVRSPQIFLKKYIEENLVNDLAKEKEKLVKKIPAGASVIASFQFLSHLAQRHNLSSLHFVSSGYKMLSNDKYEAPKDLEYALIDFNEPLILSSFFYAQSPQNLRSFLEAGSWNVLAAAYDIVLFKKERTGGSNLCAIAQNPRIENKINVRIGEHIIFLGYNLVKTPDQEDNILHLVYYWKRIGETKDRFPGFFLQLLDGEGNIRFFVDHALGYRVYIPEAWPEERIVQEHHYIPIPGNIPKGRYKLRLGWFNLEDRIMLEVSDKDKIDALGRLILGDVLW